MDFAKAASVFAALERHKVRYAVFGGAALNLHGVARFTEDIDLFIEPDRMNIETLKRALRDVFDDPDIAQISADDLLGDYPAVQYIPPSGEFHIDLLTRLGDAFQFNDLELERIRFGDVEISVVTPKTLYLMKKDTVRLKDRADAELLRARFRIEVE